MEIVHLSAYKHLYKEERLYDDEQPLNKNTPDFDFRRPIDDHAPYVVVVQGPCNVGKSMLIESLERNNIMKGVFFPDSTVRTVTTTFPVLTASGKVIRLQFVECPDDINGMIDAAKYADVVILMVDASYGFEMETFEFRNLLQVHGFPKVIGVLTHLDEVGVDKLSEVIPRLMDRFRTEICEVAKVFTLMASHQGGLYEMDQVDGLRKMLSDSQFLPLSWRAKHPYVLVDRFEDVTPERQHGDNQFNRNLSLYGYLRGCDIKKGARVHIAGAGDFSLAGVTRSYDPCPVGLSHFEDCKTGNYVRLDVLDVPPEIVEKFDHRYPILVGGILPEEENSGYMQVKLRRHSWRMDLLITGAPITVSAGWRRYLTTTIYAMENENGQHQLLNYTPEHKDCLAVFWGPLAPPQTKIVVVHDRFYSLKNKEAFRIMAKGVVLDFNREAQILLKVEKIGIAVQPSGKTAHIKFAPELKIEKLIGVPIQTKSGSRGKIDEAAGEGIVKCTFEDHIHMSDTFLIPILATLVLPSLFKQFNLLFKPLEIAVGGSLKAIITATTAAIDTAVAATIVAVDATIAEDELAVAYQKVAPRRDRRRAVVIHEGTRGYLSIPNPLESFYSSVERKVIKERKCWVAGEISGEVTEKHSLDRSGEEAKEEQISGEVKGSEPVVINADAVRSKDSLTRFLLEMYDKEKHCSEPMVFDDDVVRPGESAVQSYVRRYGKAVPYNI